MKKVSFWTTLFSIFVILFNYFGFDDMNIIMSWSSYIHKNN